MARALIPLAQGCEELEAVTLIDLFRRAGIETVVAGLEAGPVRASRGVVLLPDATLEAVMEQHFDLIVLPGGMPGSDHLDRDPRIHRLLKQIAAQGGQVAAICAAPQVLAHAGILDGKRATSYPGVLDKMHLPAVKVDLVPVVRDGKVITSRGPGTAMDFALELIQGLLGPAKRSEVEASLVR